MFNCSIGYVKNHFFVGFANFESYKPKTKEGRIEREREEEKRTQETM